MPEKIPEPWLAFLTELDATLSEEFALHCLGGFVVTLVYDFSRTTSDIDILVIISTDDTLRTLVARGGKRSPLHNKHGVYLDCVTVAKVPEDYENRLGEIFEGTFKHLRLLALDPYDLALSKLERNEQPDRDDVKHLARKVPLDPDILQQRYHEELRWQLGNPAREDATLRLWIEMIEEERRKQNHS